MPCAAVREDKIFQALADPSRRAILQSLTNWIAPYRAFWTEHVDRLEQLLEKMDE